MSRLPSGIQTYTTHSVWANENDDETSEAEQYFSYGVLHFIDGKEIAMDRRYTERSGPRYSAFDFAMTFQFQTLSFLELKFLERHVFDSEKMKRREEEARERLEETKEDEASSKEEMVENRAKERGSNSGFVVEVIMYTPEENWEERPTNIVRSHTIRKVTLAKMIMIMERNSKLQCESGEDDF